MKELARGHVANQGQNSQAGTTPELFPRVRRRPGERQAETAKNQGSFNKATGRADTSLEGAVAGREISSSSLPTKTFAPKLGSKSLINTSTDQEQQPGGQPWSGRQVRELSWAPPSPRHPLIPPAYGLPFPQVSTERRSFPQVKPSQDPRAASDLEPSILRLTFPSSFSQRNHNILLPLNSS